MTIGNWIREERGRLGLSQNELAFRTHISPRLIGRWERGEGEPNITNLVKLTEAFGVPLPWGPTASSDRPTGSFVGRDDWPMLPMPMVLAHARS